MAITRQRALEIASVIYAIFDHLDSITEEELQELQTEAQKDSAVGPFLDPSAYQGGARFKLNQAMGIIAKSLSELKTQLKSARVVSG